eukprot:scaffold119235_cov27-Phaeocystis_antarctica.AAC.1
MRSFPAAHMLVSVGAQVAGRRGAATTGSFASTILGASSPRRTRAGYFEPEIAARSSARVVGGLHWWQWCEHRRVWTEDTADARKTGQIT